MQVSWQQCDRKWRNLKTYFLRKRAQNRRTGQAYPAEGNRQWEFYDAMEEAIHTDNAANPNYILEGGAGDFNNIDREEVG